MCNIWCLLVPIYISKQTSARATPRPQVILPCFVQLFENPFVRVRGRLLHCYVLDLVIDIVTVRAMEGWGLMMHSVSVPNVFPCAERTCLIPTTWYIGLPINPSYSVAMYRLVMVSLQSSWAGISPSSKLL
ncbi:hypothetical protein GGS21DRAFT_409335 [Xylaria nigripes]|nr:hypothetical protein GGS21DRAFT_409335 [Xylaria nigripes]